MALRRSVRTVVAALALAVLLGGCGLPSQRRSMEMVASATLVVLKPDATSSAAAFARQQARHLGPSGWTYHTAAGALSLPANFRDACLELGDAWAAAAQVLPDDRNLTQARDAHDARGREAFEGIDVSYARVRAAAKTHGVSMPRTWLQA